MRRKIRWRLRRRNDLLAIPRSVGESLDVFKFSETIHSLSNGVFFGCVIHSDFSTLTSLVVPLTIRIRRELISLCQADYFASEDQSFLFLSD